MFQLNWINDIIPTKYNTFWYKHCKLFTQLTIVDFSTKVAKQLHQKYIKISNYFKVEIKLQTIFNETKQSTQNFLFFMEIFIGVTHSVNSLMLSLKLKSLDKRNARTDDFKFIWFTCKEYSECEILYESLAMPSHIKATIILSLKLLNHIRWIIFGFFSLFVDDSLVFFVLKCGTSSSSSSIAIWMCKNIDIFCEFFMHFKWMMIFVSSRKKKQTYKIYDW